MSASRSHDLNRTGLASLLEQRFYDVALDLPFVRSAHGWTDVRSDDLIERFLAQWGMSEASGDRWRSWLVAQTEFTLFVSLDVDNEWHLYVAGNDRAQLGELIGQFEALMPEPAGAGDSKIAVTFWTLGPFGPVSYNRMLDVVAWNAVADNYPPVTGRQLDGLASMTGPPMSGRLMLLHGEAGTGKTSFVRSLAQAWAPWCSVDYVVDADQFFEHASYMVGTLVTDQGREDMWRLVVIEDAGEFLTADAHDRTGQGLSRLLNLTDGLVGQGLRLLVLMTTNEDADELHPAVTRPGRCLATVRFESFSAEEATEWLAERGMADAEVEGRPTLAQLYSWLPAGFATESAVDDLVVTRSAAMTSSGRSLPRKEVRQ